LAVKIVRQPKKIALMGAPTSAAALAPGHERAPAALRAAGLVERLRAVGYEVADLGDCPLQSFQPDDEHPRMRNLPAVQAALNDLKPRVEQAVKSGALPLILGGDCIIALATLAGVHRYYRNVSLVYVDRDADLNVPASTPSGCIDGMVVSHVVGRGAPELVRFWGEPPLVREPDVALFGVDRLDAPEQELLGRSPIRRYMAAEVQREGPAAVAEAALERIHTSSHEFVLHFDVDVISADDFRATNLPAPGGLRLEEVRQALSVFAGQKNLAAVEITAYNPDLDPDGSAARLLVDLLVAVLTARLAAPASAEAAATPTGAAAATPVTDASPAVLTTPVETPATEASGPGAPTAAVEPGALASGEQGTPAAAGSEPEASPTASGAAEPINPALGEPGQSETPNESEPPDS